jgi:hypothetical protein
MSSSLLFTNSAFFFIAAVPFVIHFCAHPAACIIKRGGFSVKQLSGGENIEAGEEFPPQMKSSHPSGKTFPSRNHLEQR